MDNKLILELLNYVHVPVEANPTRLQGMVGESNKDLLFIDEYRISLSQKLWQALNLTNQSRERIGELLIQ